MDNVMTGKWEISKSMLFTLFIFAVVIVGGYFAYNAYTKKKEEKALKRTTDPDALPMQTSSSLVIEPVK